VLVNLIENENVFPIKIIESIFCFIATAHFKDIISHTDDEYQYTFIVNTLAPILV